MIEFFINLIIFVSTTIILCLLLIFSFIGWKFCYKEFGLLNSLVIFPFLVLVFFVSAFSWIVDTIIRFTYSFILGCYGVIHVKSFKAFTPNFIRGWTSFLPPIPFESDDKTEK